LQKVIENIEVYMIPALARYIGAIQMLAKIFTELARDTSNIGDRMDSIKQEQG